MLVLLGDYHDHMEREGLLWSLQVRQADRAGVENLVEAAWLGSVMTGRRRH